MNKKIPNFLYKYLWDVDVKSLNPEENSSFIIERVLEFGDIDSLSWLIKTYERLKITNVLKRSRRISPKTGNFYALFFDIPRGELLCISKPFTQKQNRF